MLIRHCPNCGKDFSCAGKCGDKVRVGGFDYCFCYFCFKTLHHCCLTRFDFLKNKPNLLKEEVEICYGKDFVHSLTIDEM
jgi:hypothetical protein